MLSANAIKKQPWCGDIEERMCLIPGASSYRDREMFFIFFLLFSSSFSSPFYSPSLIFAHLPSYAHLPSLHRGRAEV